MAETCYTAYDADPDGYTLTGDAINWGEARPLIAAYRAAVDELAEVGQTRALLERQARGVRPVVPVRGLTPSQVQERDDLRQARDDLWPRYAAAIDARNAAQAALLDFLLERHRP